MYLDRAEQIDDQICASISVPGVYFGIMHSMTPPRVIYVAAFCDEFHLTRPVPNPNEVQEVTTSVRIQQIISATLYSFLFVAGAVQVQ